MGSQSEDRQSSGVETLHQASSGWDNDGTAPNSHRLNRQVAEGQWQAAAEGIEVVMLIACSQTELDRSVLGALSPGSTLNRQADRPNSPPKRDTGGRLVSDEGGSDGAQTRRATLTRRRRPQNWGSVSNATWAPWTQSHCPSCPFRQGLKPVGQSDKPKILGTPSPRTAYAVLS